MTVFDQLSAARALLTQTTTLLAQIEAGLRGQEIVGPPTDPTDFPAPADPLAANCRGHAIVDGVVTGIHLTLHKLPGARYRCVACRMLPVAESDGNPNVAVTILDRNGQPAPERARMGTGYSGQPHFAALLPPGNPENKFFMGHDAAFTPPNLGPLGFVIVDGRGQIISDAVCSWGLPYGHHIGGVIVFQEVA